MPANLTWWAAAKFARAGVPVRRESVTDPLAWFSHDVPGLFFRYEEENGLLGSPAPADPVHRVVVASQFVAADFTATDWTTFGLVPGTDVLPVVDPVPPGGLPPGYPVVDPPTFPPIADPPPFTRPPRPVLPHWESLSAVLGSGSSFSCAGTLVGMPAGTGWLCFADVPLTPVVTLGIGGGFGAGNASCSGSATLPAEAAGSACQFRAVCVQGVGGMLGRIVTAGHIIAVA